MVRPVYGVEEEMKVFFAVVINILTWTGVVLVGLTSLAIISKVLYDYIKWVWGWW